MNKPLIGKGTFSEVYDNGNGTVEIHTNDWAKECLALFVDTKSTLLPSLERIDIYDNHHVYEMKKLPKVRSPKKQLSKRSYVLYCLLRKIMKNGLHWNSEINRIIRLFETLPSTYRSEKRVLLDYVQDLSLIHI